MEQIVIFTRYPEPGQTKTRLIPALGAEGAAKVHRKMADHTIATVRQLQQSRPLSAEVRFTGATRAQMTDWWGDDLSYSPQGTGDLGDRMMEAAAVAFEKNCTAVVIIGTDCPAITPDLLAVAFDKLRESEVVFGPATDGGYYLIGLSRSLPELFRGIDWGTASVLQQSRTICQTLNLSVAELPPLTDIDRPEDLEMLDIAIEDG
ncbi:MAG: TIGR04282 family arsenosugar biosynthesis glycosyltransferase [Limnospira sp.]